MECHKLEHTVNGTFDSLLLTFLNWNRKQVLNIK